MGREKLRVTGRLHVVEKISGHRGCPGEKPAHQPPTALPYPEMGFVEECDRENNDPHHNATSVGKRRYDGNYDATDELRWNRQAGSGYGNTGDQPNVNQEKNKRA